MPDPSSTTTSEHRRFRRLVGGALITLLIAIILSFMTIPVYISRDDPYIPSDAAVRARMHSRQITSLENGIFIGVGISGGGNRAANFSLAVLEELERHSFLDHLTALSTVSGGSLTAAYYALFRNSPEWDWQDIRSKMRTDFSPGFSSSSYFPTIFYFASLLTMIGPISWQRFLAKSCTKGRLLMRWVILVLSGGSCENVSKGYELSQAVGLIRTYYK